MGAKAETMHKTGETERRVGRPARSAEPLRRPIRQVFHSQPHEESPRVKNQSAGFY